MVKLRFRSRIQVTFADGGIAVVAFRHQSLARIEIVLRAWALLHQREVTGWERTSLPAEFWYDGQKRHMCPMDDPICRDLLALVIPLAIAFQQRQREVVELRKRGCGIKEIARELEMPVATVSKMLEEHSARPPVR